MQTTASSIYLWIEYIERQYLFCTILSSTPRMFCNQALYKYTFTQAHQGYNEKQSQDIDFTQLQHGSGQPSRLNKVCSK